MSLTPGNGALSMALLAAGVHTSFYPIILLAPLILVLRKRQNKPATITSALVFVAAFAALTGALTAWLGQQWMQRTWGLM